MVTFKPIHHPRWKNCKFLSPMFMLFIVFKMVETMFSIFRQVFSLISPKLHRVCAPWNFTHTAFLNMTQLLVPKSRYVWKNLGGWGCGSEQAPLNAPVLENMQQPKFLWGTIHYCWNWLWHTLSIKANILSTLFSGVLSSSGICTILPTILYIASTISYISSLVMYPSWSKS